MKWKTRIDTFSRRWMETLLFPNALCVEYSLFSLYKCIHFITERNLKASLFTPNQETKKIIILIRQWKDIWFSSCIPVYSMRVICFPVSYLFPKNKYLRFEYFCLPKIIYSKWSLSAAKGEMTLNCMPSGFSRAVYIHYISNVILRLLKAHSAMV